MIHLNKLLFESDVKARVNFYSKYSYLTVLITTISTSIETFSHFLIICLTPNIKVKIKGKASTKKN